MIFNTGNPVDEAAEYYHNLKEEVNEMHKCEYSNDYFDEDKMVCNKEGLWIAKRFLEDHLKSIENEMLIEDFEKYKQHLEKQL